MSNRSSDKSLTEVRSRAVRVVGRQQQAVHCSGRYGRTEFFGKNRFFAARSAKRSFMAAAPLAATEYRTCDHESLARLHLKFPFTDLRLLRALLAGKWCKIHRRHVKTPMLGKFALYRRPNTSKAGVMRQDLPSSAAYDFRAEMQVMDIVDIPVACGFN